MFIRITSIVIISTKLKFESFLREENTIILYIYIYIYIPSFGITLWKIYILGTNNYFYF